MKRVIHVLFVFLLTLMLTFMNLQMSVSASAESLKTGNEVLGERTSICFDANGGSFRNESDKLAVSVAGGESLPGYIEIPVNKGNLFTGWYYDEQCRTKVDDLAKVDLIQNNVIYSGWKSLDSFGSSFDEMKAVFSDYSLYITDSIRLEIAERMQDDYRKLNSFFADAEVQNLKNKMNRFEKDKVDYLFGNYDGKEYNAEIRSFWDKQKKELFPATDIYVVKSIQPHLKVVSVEKTEDKASILVNEWVTVGYNDPSISDAVNAFTADYEYSIDIDPAKASIYTVSSNSINESEKNSKLELNKENSLIDAAGNGVKQSINSQNILMATRSASATYNVGAAIAFAKKHVNTTSGNTEYGSFFGGNGGDCANYVSNCLRAGGIPTDDIWNKYTLAWKGAISLSGWLEQFGTVMTASNENIFPGNPVFYQGSDWTVKRDFDHVTICVGYNSQGIPIINSHTSVQDGAAWNYGWSYHATIQLNKTRSADVSVSISSPAASLPSPWYYSYTPVGINRTVKNSGGTILSLATTKWIQQALNLVMSSGLDVDGCYGSGTTAAVKNFQTKYGLEADGLFGSESTSKMVQVLNSMGYYEPGSSTGGQLTLPNTRTIDDGTYSITCAANNNYALSIEADSNENNANVYLWTYGINNKYEQWQFNYIGDGYYSITNKGSGKRLDVQDFGGSLSNVQQYSGSSVNSAEKFQVVPAGSGNYYLVPQCATNCAVDVTNSDYARGTNVIIFKQTLNPNQRFTLKKHATNMVLQLNNVTLGVGESRTIGTFFTPTDVSDKTVTWTSSNTSVATVNSSGTITAKAIGQATVKAVSADGNFSANCYVTVKEGTIAVSGVSLSRTSLSLSMGTTALLAATVSPNNATDKSVTWRSSNTNVATVSSSGLVTAVNAGTATITVTTNNSGKTATCNVTVTPVTTASLPNPWYYSETPVGEYSVSSSISNQVRWIQQAFNVIQNAGLDVDGDFGTNTKNAIIAFQNSHGLNADGVAGENTIAQLVLAANAKGYGKDGTLSLTPDDQGADFYAYITNQKAWKTVTVENSNNVVLKTEINGVIGDPSQVFHFTRISTSPVMYKIISLKNNYALDVQDAKDEDLANVQTYGWWGGDAQKWEVFKDKGNWFLRPRTSAGSTRVLDVYNGDTADGTNIELYHFYMVDNGAQRFSLWRWPGIATPTVTTNGSSVTVKWGTTSDTAKYDVEFYKDGNLVKTVSGITGTSTTQTLEPGNYQVRVVSWSSTYTTQNNKGYNTNKASFTVTAPLTGIKLSENKYNLNTGNTYQLYVTYIPTNTTDSQTVTWTTSNSSVAAVSSSGLVTAKAAGTAVITATSTVNTAIKATCTFTVNPIAVTGVSLNKTETAITIGGTEQLTAAISPSNAVNKNVIWTSSNTSVATVSSGGLVTAKAVGSANITVITEDGGKTASCIVTVNPIAVTGVTLNKNSTTLTVDDTEQLTATIKPDNATYKNVVWTSSDTGIATVSSTGLVTAKAPGTAVITVITEDGIKTASCTVTVKSEVPEQVKITQHPVNVTTAAGNTAKFTVAASGTNLTYQWQWSPDSGRTWKDSTSATTGYRSATLQVEATEKRNGYQYRCVVSDGYSSATSDFATLTVTVTKPEITTQPQNVTTAVGNTAKFTVAASGTGLTYQWQWSADNGKTWKDSSSATTGYRSATLQVTATTARNGYQYRCKVSNSAGTVTSYTAILTVTVTKPVITTQPKNVTTAVGNTAKFTVAASGTGLTYQWQWSADNGKTWKDSTSATTGYRSATLQVTATTARNGYQYRCKVSNSAGTVISDTAALNVK